MEIYDGLPTSIKYWKEVFFFMHIFAFTRRMFYAATTNKVVDPSPDFSLEEESMGDRLLDNFVKCFDPEEIMLSTAGINSYWKFFLEKTYGNPSGS